MQNQFIDLYSDTKTKPTPGMRKAMYEAEVGDEQKFEDPTVNRLRERVCDLLGKEDAVFLPSGTMCNQIAIRVHCRPGEEIICDRSAHIIRSEGGGPGANAGVMFHPLEGPQGVFTAAMAEAAVKDPNNRYMPRTRLIEIEQTANLGGGALWPLDGIEAVGAVARKHGLKLHMDGARLPNACAKSGVKAAAYAAPCDTLWIDFTKGLGAPVGAILAGSKDFIHEAWRVKQQLGGSMRQSGIVAAAGLYALENHWDRLSEDHDNANRLARGLAEIPGIEIDPDALPTNLVFFELRKPGWTAPRLMQAMKAENVGIGAFSATTVRVVTHLDVSRDDIDTALAAFRRVLAA
ncbi:MAG: threonine aldolase family protein [Rhodospirillales bacterium]|nr:MAG: threonine aldolase family protein [Rhodospirillales bacterium]